MTQADYRVWTVAEAKARLSEILRLSEEEGPQRIGARKSFVVVPESVWQGHESPPKSGARGNDKSARKPLGQWLVDNLPCGIELELPNRKETGRPIPFVDY